MRPEPVCVCEVMSFGGRMSDVSCVVKMSSRVRRFTCVRPEPV